MKIAVLAWGSVVWDPQDLRAAGTFAPNGPLLPIEFRRVSADGRLTLVIDETFGAICTTYSAPSALQNLDAAVENLRGREGMQLARGVALSKLLPASGATSPLSAMRKLSKRSRPGRNRTAATPQSGRRWRAISVSPTKPGSRSPSLRRSGISKRWKKSTL